RAPFPRRLVLAGATDATARGHEPALLGLRTPVHLGREEWHEPAVEGLTGLVGRRSVALDAEHPGAPLPVAAALEAADEARHVERIGDRGSGRDHVVGDAAVERAARSCKVLDASCRGARACTHIATAPGVGRRQRSYIYRVRHRPVQI